MQIEISDPAIAGERRTETTWDGNTGTFNAPRGATVVATNSAVQANAIATAAMAAPGAGVTNYVQKVRFYWQGATAALNVTATIAGLLGGTLSIPVLATADPTAPGSYVIDFGDGLPASAANIAITASIPALGAGNVFAVASIQGYKR